MIALIDLLTIGIREILESPDLSRSVVRYYSILYAGGMTVRGCNSSIQMYYRRLQIDGLQTQKRLEMAKYQLKKDVGCIRFKSQMYNSSTITDEIAEQIIAEYPAQAKAFIIKDGVSAKANPATKSTGTEKDKLIAKAASLGIEGVESLSVKKIKDAITGKEIELQEHKETLILLAIDAGIEGAEEMTIEQLEIALQ